MNGVPADLAGLTPGARDFAPSLLAIQEDPPSPLPRAAVLAVVACVALLLAWTAWARLDIVATAPGRIVPLSFTKVVQPAEAGVVAEVLVRDGDHVQAGQVLLRMDARIARADGRTLGEEAELRRLTLARIDAELAGRPLVLPPGASRALAAQVQAQFAARRRLQEDQWAQEHAALVRTDAELAAAQQLEARLREVLPIVRAAARQHEQLRQEGFVSALVAADRQRELVEKSRELEAQLETVRALRAARAQQQRKLDNVQSGLRAQLQAERLEQLAQLQRLAQEQSKSRVRTGHLEIRAPASGVVKDLSITAPGAVVPSGALLMHIVPQDEPLQAEVSLRNEDVGFVHPGQAARLKLATYPFQRHGLLEGVVTHIAADASQVPQVSQVSQVLPLPQAGAAGPPGPAYRAFIRLATPHLVAPDGRALPLAPGMLLAAEIHQGERSVIEYLLSPVRKVAGEAARER